LTEETVKLTFHFSVTFESGRTKGELFRTGRDQRNVTDRNCGHGHFFHGSTTTNGGIDINITLIHPLTDARGQPIR